MRCFANSQIVVFNCGFSYETFFSKLFILFVFHRLRNVRLLRNRPLIVQNFVARGTRFIVRYVGHTLHKMFWFDFKATADKVPQNKNQDSCNNYLDQSQQTDNQR